MMISDTLVGFIVRGIFSFVCCYFIVKFLWNCFEENNVI